MALPSQVVKIIDDLYLPAKDNQPMGPAGIDGKDPPRIRTILSLAKQVPQNLIVLAPDRESEYLQALSEMEEALEHWKHDKGFSFLNMTTHRKLHAIQVIREVMSNCSDSAPQPLKLKPIRGFLGYSTADKEMAGRIKDNLEFYGIEIFLAHETLEISDEWRETILGELKECDFYIALVSQNFKESEWTDQEFGSALARNVPIYPLGFGLKPYGFFEKFQSSLISLAKLQENCEKIAKKLAHDERVSSIFKRDLIKKFALSKSFHEAGSLARLFHEFPTHTEEDMQQILSASIKNSQIYCSFDAQAELKKLVNRYLFPFLKTLINEFEGKLQSFQPAFRLLPEQS